MSTARHAAAPDRVHLVYATDPGYVVPTCVSVFSALEATSGPVRVTVLGVGLGPEQLDKLRATVGLFPSARLDVIRFEVGDFDNIPANLTATTLARLSIPQVLTGRVLYIDPDTLVQGDLRPLWQADLGGAPIGAVPDLGVAVDQNLVSAPPLVKRRKRVRYAQGQLDDLSARLPQVSHRSYVNAGVLVFDLDVLGTDSPQARDLADASGALSYLHLDQDWLNLVFCNQIHVLPARWNVLAGNLPIRRMMGVLRQRDPGAQPAILHYAGHRKPWHRFRLSMIGRGYRFIRRWQRVARRWAQHTGLQVPQP